LVTVDGDDVFENLLALSMKIQFATAITIIRTAIGEALPSRKSFNKFLSVPVLQDKKIISVYTCSNTL
jgi:hypothetical protein